MEATEKQEHHAAHAEAAKPAVKEHALSSKSEDSASALPTKGQKAEHAPKHETKPSEPVHKDAVQHHKETAVPAVKAPESKAELLFGKWNPKEVRIVDYSLAKYIDLESKKIPHTFGAHVNKAMAKAKISIVERLVNKIMRSGQGKRKLSGKYIRGRGSCGKKQQAIHIVESAFMIVEKQTGENPVQVLVRAIERSAPREDTTRLTRGGISYSQAVDVAPLKRIDESLKNIAIAGFAQSFNNKTTAPEALAKELVLASKEDPQSFSIKRRDEIERIAKASR